MIHGVEKKKKKKRCGSIRTNGRMDETRRHWRKGGRLEYRLQLRGWKRVASKRGVVVELSGGRRGGHFNPFHGVGRPLTPRTNL